MKELSDYKELINKVGKDDFDSRFRELQNYIDKYLEEANYPASVKCNDRILANVLVDYYSDIYRLKEFHEIEKTNKTKIVAYTVYWILKRKPIQINDSEIDVNDVFVNERFACNFLISECIMDEKNRVISKDKEEQFLRYLDFLMYYFIYREYNAQVIETIIESLKIGLLL